ncbi:MAG TPA: ABC transporter substrate-binding protein [Bradyrhizobium sp.]|nr:ABC transporter substrate-binding protein [Bradyrhizobium sp.]
MWQKQICILALVLVTILADRAAGQSAGQAPRIGLLAWSSCEGDVPGGGEFDPFVRGLVELGYKPGESIIIECRSAGRRYDHLAVAAAELVQIPVDVIVSSSEPAGRSAHRVTDKVPIVTIVSGDPVAAGLAQSLAKPGGNVTGASYYATELTAKRLEFLQELLPGITTVDVLSNPDVAYLPFENDAKQAAGRLGITLRIRLVRKPEELDNAFSTMELARAQAVFVLPDLMFAWEGERIAALALKYRVPSMAWGTWFTEVGCLMSYSARYDEMQQRLAFYVDRILKGAKPGDLPIEQPTTFDLSINLKTAKALGVQVPETLLLRADKIVE